MTVISDFTLLQAARKGQARKKPGPKKKDPAAVRRRALLDRNFVAQIDKLLAWKE